MRSICKIRHTPAASLLGLLALPLIQVAAYAQIIDIDGVTRVVNNSAQYGYSYNTWKPIPAASTATVESPIGDPGARFLAAGGFMMDPVYDQQTGQGDSDFVSSATTIPNTTVVTSVNPGFFVQFGTINYGGTNVEHIGFRVLMNEFKTTGNVVNIRFGMDADSDGKIDLYIGLNQQNGQQGIDFKYPNQLTSAVNTANSSPSTTDWGNALYPKNELAVAGVKPAFNISRVGLPALNAGGNALALVDGSNFSNVRLEDGTFETGTGRNVVTVPSNLNTFYPGWVTQNEAGQLKQDSIISFALPVADVNFALAHNRWLKTTTTYTPPAITLTSSSYTRWVATTATQENSVNQDAYGYGKGDFNNTWSSMITPINGDGLVQVFEPIPEPSTYGLFGAVALLGVGLLRRRSRR